MLPENDDTEMLTSQERADGPYAELRKIPRLGAGPSQRQLVICEGKCNPQLEQVDAAVSKFRKDTPARGGPVLPPYSHIVDSLRSLRHTWHRVQGGGVYGQCETCGTRRRICG